MIKTGHYSAPNASIFICQRPDTDVIFGIVEVFLTLSLHGLNTVAQFQCPPNQDTHCDDGDKDVM